MHSLFRLAFAAACVAAVPGAGAAPDTTRAPATLQFRSQAGALAGISFGIDAVDARRNVLGERLQAQVAAGHRTIRYSCPNEAAPRDGSRISFDFEAGASYTLTCRAGGEAEIRRTDDC